MNSRYKETTVLREEPKPDDNRYLPDAIVRLVQKERKRNNEDDKDARLFARLAQEYEEYIKVRNEEKTQDKILP